MSGCKDQLIRKYYRKFLVSNISHIELIIYIKKFTIVNILGWKYKHGNMAKWKYKQQLSHIRFQLNFWQNINKELFKVE